MSTSQDSKSISTAFQLLQHYYLITLFDKLSNIVFEADLQNYMVDYRHIAYM